MKKPLLYVHFFVISLISGACSVNTDAQATGTIPPISPMPTHEFTPTGLPESTPVPFSTNVRIEDDAEYRIPSMMGFDAIAPIYKPTFASVDEAPMEESELVMGVAIDGQAKAYPVNVLRFREMVNDELAGWPILVTW